MPEQTLPNGGKVQVFEPPSKDFDFVKASDEALRQCGVPPRPADDAPARLREWWERTFSRHPRYVVPNFRSIRLPHMGKRGLTKFGGDTKIWAGSIVQPAKLAAFDSSSSIVSVFAQWTVPNVYFSEYGFNADNYVLSSWIGIDGFGAYAPQRNATELLQAGYIVADTANGGTFSWWEWFPNSPFELDMTVNPGDVVWSQIITNNIGPPGALVIYFGNVTSNLWTSFVPSGTEGQAVQGYCAEWIIELQQGANLPNFVEIYYDPAYAMSVETGRVFLGKTTSSTKYVNVNQGALFSLSGQTNTILATPTILTPEVMKVTWNASQ